MSETFTKEWLQLVSHGRPGDIPRLDKTISNLAAFALAQMEEKEAAEAEIVNHESWLTTQQAATYAAEAERDEARRELQEAEEAIRFVVVRLNEDKHKPRDPAGEEIYEWKAGSAVLRARERGKVAP